MKAVLFDQFARPIRVDNVAEPIPPADGVVIEVRAAGVCRSDWHGWQGHDSDICSLPHVPGHEFAGIVAEVGRDVRKWRVGDRVTMPFVAGCGNCRECHAGDPQVCDQQFQPGFTAWGAFAERVAVRYSDFNLVRLPENLEFAEAACLGCRLATAYRAVALQGRVRPGEWVAVFGCGGLGLSAVMLTAALGARPIAIDIQPANLKLAASFGAERTILLSDVDDPVEAVREMTGGGADLSLDAVGAADAAANSIRSLRKRGRHVQVGLLAGADFQPRLPMELVIARELEILGSHGLAAADYPSLLELVTQKKLDVSRLIARHISLSAAPQAIVDMGCFSHQGITVIDQF